MEWSNQNKYNSFNSYKGLAYYEKYKDIARWMKGSTNYLPPPIECSIDPIAHCNLKCYYCNSQRYLRDNPDEIPSDTRMMSEVQMIKLIDFMADWGVKGICFGGGGESLLNKDVWDLPRYIHNKGMETGIVTNGTASGDWMKLVWCRWVGFSVDAADKETFLKIKGVDLFDKVIQNIKYLVDIKSKVENNLDIAFKFLVLPENWMQIFDACRLAKELGVQDFHVRPVDLERKDFKSAKQINLEMFEIRNQFNLCHQLEDDIFHVYTVLHKYDDEFHVKHDFNRCLASPLVIQCCTDGYCYVCVDHRIEPRFRLGKWDNIQEWWGSRKHLEVIQSINPHKECSRCTWSEYNRQIEDAVIKDRMCLKFP